MMQSTEWTEKKAFLRHMAVSTAEKLNLPFTSASGPFPVQRPNMKHCCYPLDVLVGYRNMELRLAREIPDDVANAHLELELCVHDLRYKKILGQTPDNAGAHAAFQVYAGTMHHIDMFPESARLSLRTGLSEFRNLSFENDTVAVWSTLTETLRYHLLGYTPPFSQAYQQAAKPLAICLETALAYDRETTERFLHVPHRVVSEYLDLRELRKGRICITGSPEVVQNLARRNVLLQVEVSDATRIEGTLREAYSSLSKRYRRSAVEDTGNQTSGNSSEQRGKLLVFPDQKV